MKQASHGFLQIADTWVAHLELDLLVPHYSHYYPHSGCQELAAISCMQFLAGYHRAGMQGFSA